MAHQEYIRTVDGSPVAVLMIHGIAGTPDHFRDLLPIIPRSWSVYNILLDGHGKAVKDFGATSMQKWKAQVTAVLNDLLARHEQVVLIAHSMGTLFAIQAAIDHPDRIPRLFLLSVPSRPWLRLSTALTALRLSWGNIRDDDAAAVAMQNACSIRLNRRLWEYLTWIPRFWELLTEIRRVRRILPQLAVPCETFQSQVDELVSARSCRDLEGHPHIRNTVLYGSGHFAYSPEDTHLLQARLKETLSSLEN